MSLRRPRLLIATGGVNIAPLECTLHQTTHQSSDHFSATVALTGLPGLNYWADEAPMPVEIFGSNDGMSFLSMFTGDIDKVAIDFDIGNVKISGRDKTQRLIDKKTNETWKNRSEKDIITDLAGRVGLSAEISGGELKAGLEYSDEHHRISNLDNYHNIIIRLARQMGCVAYVKGDKLIVKPVDEHGGSSFNLYYRAPTRESYAEGNWVKMHASRNLQLAKPIKVNHRSWRHQKEEVVESEYEMPGKGDALNYQMTATNLTKQQQDELAKSKVAQIASHERALRIETPGDVNIDVQGELVLSGTNSSFDQGYIISQIEHRFDGRFGYTMTIMTRGADRRRGKVKKNK